MKEPLLHGFRLRLKGCGVDYAFRSRSNCNKALRQIKRSLRDAGLTAVEFDIEVREVKKGRRIRLI